MQLNSSYLSSKYKNWVQRELALQINGRVQAEQKFKELFRTNISVYSLTIRTECIRSRHKYISTAYQRSNTLAPHIFILVSIKYYFYPIYIKINKILFMSFVHIIITPRATPAAQQTHNSRCRFQSTILRVLNVDARVSSEYLCLM